MILIRKILVSFVLAAIIVYSSVHLKSKETFVNHSQIISSFNNKNATKGAYDVIAHNTTTSTDHTRTSPPPSPPILEEDEEELLELERLRARLSSIASGAWGGASGESTSIPKVPASSVSLLRWSDVHIAAVRGDWALGMYKIYTHIYMYIKT